MAQPEDVPVGAIRGMGFRGGEGGRGRSLAGARQLADARRDRQDLLQDRNVPVEVVFEDEGRGNVGGDDTVAASGAVAGESSLGPGES